MIINEKVIKTYNCPQSSKKIWSKGRRKGKATKHFGHHQRKTLTIKK